MTPEEFGAAWRALAEADRALASMVDELRADGYTWEEIGAEARVTAQAMSQWRKRRPGGRALRRFDNSA